MEAVYPVLVDRVLAGQVGPRIQTVTSDPPSIGCLIPTGFPNGLPDATAYCSADGTRPDPIAEIVDPHLERVGSRVHQVVWRDVLPVQEGRLVQTVRPGRPKRLNSWAIGWANGVLARCSYSTS